MILEKGLMNTGKGILISATQDGRLVFVLPYKGYTMIGTTDIKDEPSLSPTPTESEIEFLKNEGRKILGKDFDYEGTVKSVWSGQRPLVLKGKNTEEPVLSGIEKVLNYFNKKVDSELSSK